MTIPVADVRAYCRFGTEVTDAEVNGLVAMAKEYLDSAGVPDPVATSARYGLVVKALAADYYDLRGSHTESPLSPNPAVRDIINQLKLEAEAQQIAGLAT